MPANEVMRTSPRPRQPAIQPAGLQQVTCTFWQPWLAANANHEPSQSLRQARQVVGGGDTTNKMVVQRCDLVLERRQPARWRHAPGGQSAPRGWLKRQGTPLQTIEDKLVPARRSTPVCGRQDEHVHGKLIKGRKHLVRCTACISPSGCMAASGACYHPAAGDTNVACSLYSRRPHPPAPAAHCRWAHHCTAPSRWPDHCSTPASPKKSWRPLPPAPALCDPMCLTLHYLRGLICTCLQLCKKGGGSVAIIISWSMRWPPWPWLVQQFAFTYLLSMYRCELAGGWSLLCEPVTVQV